MPLDMKTFEEITKQEAYQGYVRYETIRLLNPREQAIVRKRNMAGRNFDEMIDELSKITDWKEREEWFK